MNVSWPYWSANLKLIWLALSMLVLRLRMRRHWLGFSHITSLAAWAESGMAETARARRLVRRIGRYITIGVN